jgi:hypothetical protein
MKLSTVPWEETCKISRDYATTAIKTIHKLRQTQEKPLRFIYMSGHFAPRSRAEIPAVLANHGMVDYGLLRVCRCESDATPRLPGFLQEIDSVTLLFMVTSMLTLCLG